ncbi:MAG TPA: septation protein SepH, partial [Actinomycetales bacterium]
MHELRLVGVHEDGEHLMLTGADGARFLLRVDDAVRAAVRRDRSRLGQLQIEIEGGLRPRDVQARIRAGISAEDVAAMAGWTVEKVRRYEGPVLAERAHVADLARAVRVRRRSAEPVALGALVAQRLTDRGVDAARVVWDAWRPDTGPWVVVVAFSAGEREREARWHFDVGAASVTAADDEARWLSEDEPAAGGPLAGGRLAAATAGRPGAVYDIEADGGVGAEPRRDLDGGPFDLVGAMRSRRRERASTRSPAARRRPPTHGGTRVESTGDRPSDVPGSMQGSIPGSTHPAGRKRVQPEPLELDPTL